MSTLTPPPVGDALRANADLRPIVDRAIGAQPVVLYYMREFACPICMGHVRLLAARLSELRSLGVGAVAIIGPGHADEARALRSRVKAPELDIVADPEHRAFDAVGLERRMSVQRSGTFVFAPDGQLHEISTATVPIRALDYKRLTRTLEGLERGR